MSGITEEVPHLHGLPGHDLDGDVVPNGGHLLEEDDGPVP